MLNHFKILNFQRLSCLVGLFGLKSFHGFVSLAQLEDVTDCLSSVLFCIVLFVMARSSKNIQKNTNMRQHRCLDQNPTSFLNWRIKF